MTVTVRRLDTFGIEVGGFSVHGPIPDDVRRELYARWLEHGLVLFRGTGASRAEHLRLSEVFGTVEPHPVERVRVPEEPKLMKLAGDSGNYVVDGVLRAGFLPWHQDTVYSTEICKGALLHMDQPAARGGDTAWIDTAMAYDALPGGTRAAIDGLSVVMRVHLDDAGLRFARRCQPFRLATADEAPPARYVATSQPPPVVHPLVAVHPETGRRSLTIAPLYVDAIEGMDPAEGEALIESLVDHTVRPEFTQVHHWEAGDIVLWDNRRTMHSAAGWDPALTRVAYRTTLAGGLRTGRVLGAAVS
jgi:taurine dioxygenase